MKKQSVEMTCDGCGKKDAGVPVMRQGEEMFDLPEGWVGIRIEMRVGVGTTTASASLLEVGEACGDACALRAAKKFVASAFKKGRGE